MCLSGKGIESPSQGQLSAASRATLRCLHSTTRPPQPAVTMQHRGARRCSADHCWRALHRVTGGTDPCACKGVRGYPPGGHVPLGSGPCGRCDMPRAIAQGDTIKTLNFYRTHPVLHPTTAHPSNGLQQLPATSSPILPHLTTRHRTLQAGPLRSPSRYGLAYRLVPRNVTVARCACTDTRGCSRSHLLQPSPT